MQIGVSKPIFWKNNKIDFDISCKLSPKKTYCMKWQSLFSGKIRKISIFHLLNLHETIYLKYQSLFSGKSKKNINLSSAYAESARDDLHEMSKPIFWER